MLRYIYIVFLLSGLLLCAPLVAAVMENENDIMIVLSNSDSMKKQDAEFSTLPAISHFIQGTYENTRIAILSFDEHVNVISPLTHIDLETIGDIKHRIKTLKPQGPLSNAAAAVERSIYELKAHARDKANKIIILITDTYIHTVDPNDDHTFEKWLREILVKEAAEADIQVFGIAIGKDADIQSLQVLANKTGGDWYQANATHETRAALDKIHQTLFSEGQILAQTSEFSPIPLKNAVEPPPLQTTANSDIYSKDSWPSPPTTDQEKPVQQSHTTEIISDYSTAAQEELEPVTTEPESSPQIITVNPNSIGQRTENSALLLITAALLGLAAVIGVIWALRNRRRSISNSQNKQKTQMNFTPPGTGKDVFRRTVIRSEEIALPADTADKTTIRPNHD